ncbi:MAG: PCRF domain-containing protein, partial [Actinobacteria bacterium]|nr:PCRF domain-containing protein [Actinomycetota bacterium]
MRDFSEDLSELQRRVADARAYLHVDAASARMEELEREASKPGLWDDPDAARAVTGELSRCKDDVDLVTGLEERLSDVETLFELGREEGDDSVEPEVEQGIATLSTELDTLELRALFTGEHDERDAICEVHSGAGGTDAADWAQMLLRMFSRWGERRGFDI